MWHPKSLILIAGASATLAGAANAQGWSADFEAPTYMLGMLEGQDIWVDWTGNNQALAQVVNTQNHTSGGSQSFETANMTDTVADFDMLPGGSFDSGQWTVRAQSYVPSTSNGRVLFIVMNQWDVTAVPPHEWAVEMALSGGSNRVQTRTPNGTFEMPLIQDQWVEIRCEFDLDADSVAVFYNNTLIDTYDPRCGVLPGCGGPALDSFIDAIDIYPDPATFPGPVYFDDFAVEPAGATTLGIPYCFGDGSGTACPCGNVGGSGEGCANTTNSGAVCSALGTTSVGADDAVFTGTNMLPNQPGVLFFADNATNGGDGIVFGDGLRCAGGNLVRRGVKTPNAMGTATWGPGLLAGTSVAAGDTKRWQIWYRDPAGGGACSNAFNLSNGLETTFTP